jgi:hypothetical protein
MELALSHPAEASEKPLGCLPDVQSARRRSKRATRPQLLTRDQLDGRTNAAKVFDRLVGDIEADLGGRDQLSTIERALVEAFAGAAVTLHNLNTRLALGEQINLSEHATAVSAMVRVASRLGLQRRPRDVSPTLGEYLARYEAARPEDAAEGEEGGGEGAAEETPASGHLCGPGAHPNEDIPSA